MKEVDNNEVINKKGKNYDYLMKNGSKIYYFEDLEKISSNFYNAISAFGLTEAEEEEVSKTSISFVMLYTDKYSKQYRDDKNRIHLFTETDNVNHTKLPEEAIEDAMTGIAKIMDVLDVIEEKYPDPSCNQRKLTELFRNHIKLVIECPNYMEASNVYPDYQGIINSVFATFPSALYKNEKGKYEVDWGKFEEINNKMDLIGIAKTTQEFFMNHTVPYVEASKNNTKDVELITNYNAAFKKHILYLNDKLDNINIINKYDDYIKNNFSFKSADFNVNYKDRFATMFMKSSNVAKQLLDNGWPIEDIPMMSDVIQWYVSTEKDSKNDPTSKRYDKNLAEKSANVIARVKEAYNNLINTPITNNETRKQLLTDFNNVFKDCVKICKSGNGLKASHIEAAIAKDYMDFEFYDSKAIHKENPLDFTENAIKIKSMLKQLDDNTHWYKGGSSRNFDKMFTAFEELSKYAEKLGTLNRKPLDNEIKEYARLAIKVDKLAAYYLDNKRPSTSRYAATRVALVKEVKKNIVANIEQFSTFRVEQSYDKEDLRLYNENAREIEATYDIYAKRLIKAQDYSISSNKVREVYMGSNYTKDSFEQKKGSFSSERTAQFSLSMLALLSEVDDNGKRKYSYDDVMDPNKLKEEKSMMFDSIVKKMVESGSNDNNIAGEARKWLANLMFKSQMASIKVMDEEIAKLGLINNATLESDKFLRLQALSTAMYDIWQEMKHCKNEIVEIARDNNVIDKNGTYDDYSQYITNHNGPLCDYNQSGTRIPKLIKNYSVVPKDASGFVVNKVGETLSLGCINEWLKTDRKVPFSEWVADNNVMLVVSSAYCGGNDYAKVIEDCKDEEFRQYVIDNVINGNIFNNMKFDKPVDEVGPVNLSDYKPIGTIKDGRYDCLRGEVFTGCPTIAQFYEDYKIHKMNAVDVVNELDKVSAKIAKEAPKYAADVSANRMHKAAMKGVRDLSRLITGERPLSGRYLDDAKQSIRNVVSYSFMKEFKKSGISGDKLTAAVSEAMMYSDEFNKNTSYIGKKAIYDFAFTDLANDIVKKSAKSIFMGKARASLENLKTADYKNKNDELIKDAAYAFVAQQLRVNGEIKDPKTNAVISPDKYVDKLIGSKKFKDSLKSAPDKFKSAKDIARSALDDKAFKEANEAANNAVNHAHNAPEVNKQAKKSVGANKTEVKTVVKK